MKLVSLNSIFDVEYGNQFDLSKMVLTENRTDGINFISRSSKNFGITGRVLNHNFTEPYPEGLITVTLGGSYLLSSFIQPEKFYTAQNVKVLSPKNTMTLNEKLFYCLCIQSNRFRYSSHGREANVSLDSILIPAKCPKSFSGITLNDIEKELSKRVSNHPSKLDVKTWRMFSYEELFVIERGLGARKEDIVPYGKTPFITSTKLNNGLTGMVNSPPHHNGNTITVSRNGSVGDAFYQENAFCSTEDVHVFSPKFSLNKYIALFLVTLIRQESFKYNYGRKWSITRMYNSCIMLPAKGDKPDWDFIETYIKSLPYSKAI